MRGSVGAGELGEFCGFVVIGIVSAHENGPACAHEK